MFALGPLLQKLSGWNSIESEIAIKKLLVLGRLIKEPKMSPAVKSLFDSRSKSFFDSYITSLGVLPSIAEALRKYKLFDYFENWHDSSTFLTYIKWEKLCRIRSLILRVMHGITSVNLILIWGLLTSVLKTCLLFTRNFGISAICFICKDEAESVTHFLLDCSYFKNNFDSFWNKLKLYPVRTEEEPPGSRFFANNFGRNTQSKLSDFPKIQCQIRWKLQIFKIAPGVTSFNHIWWVLVVKVPKFYLTLLPMGGGGGGAFWPTPTD